ncbi:MAG: hypothetical protein Q7R76_04710 [Candidatus Woesearchaeota archaeon]|nr:hypothetical protein [Candidatus Woesearchaeota archaeon]
MRQLKTIFDTNIYGELLSKSEYVDLIEKIRSDGGLVVFGFREIRKELKDTPKDKATHDDSQLRIALLVLYDKLVKSERDLLVTPEIEKLAIDYHKEYQKLGGITSLNILKRDFLIVACASIKNMDIVYSDDNSTMLSKLSIESYTAINSRENLRSPNFLNFKDLRKKYNF